jgi:hypothetical protein
MFKKLLRHSMFLLFFLVLFSVHGMDNNLREQLSDLADSLNTLASLLQDRRPQTVLVTTPHQWGKNLMTENPAQCGMHSFVDGKLFMDNFKAIQNNPQIALDEKYQGAFNGALAKLGHDQWLVAEDMMQLSSTMANVAIIDNIEEIADPSMHAFFPEQVAALENAKEQLKKDQHTHLFLIQNTKQKGGERSHWIAVGVHNNQGVKTYYVMDPIRGTLPLEGDARTAYKPLESKIMVEVLQRLLEN